MPEGDTIHKLAAAMRPALESRPLEGVWLRDRGWLEPLAGLPVLEVSALGKHLLVALGAASAYTPWVLHVHLGMRSREPWPNRCWLHRRSQRQDQGQASPTQGRFGSNGGPHCGHLTQSPLGSSFSLPISPV